MSVNKIIIMLYVLLFGYQMVGFSQSDIERSIVGIWQIKTKEVSSGFLDTYKFYEGNRFSFSSNENEGLRTIISITGRYSIQGDTLNLFLEHMVVLKKGVPVISESMGGSGWELIGYKRKKVKINRLEKVLLNADGCLQDPDCFIEIQGRQYFKLE
jgi:hypothetical protein